MSAWDNIGANHDNGDEKDPVEVDWFSNNHDIFSGGRETILVDPRDVKRAETAPSVLTMYSADGTLCVGGNLEEDVPPEEEYRYTEEYHTLYYSKYPRDPRMLVPLRSCGGVRRAGETGLPGRPVATGSQKSLQDADNASDNREKNTTEMNKSQEKEGSFQHSPDKSTTYEKSVLEALSREQHKSDEHAASYLNLATDESHSDTFMMSSSNPPLSTGVALQTQPSKESSINNGSGKIQQSGVISAQSLRRGGAGGRRGPQDSYQGAQNGGAKNQARRQVNGGVPGMLRVQTNELSPIRESLEEMRHESSYEDIKGHVVALSKDQEGSRFVQRLLEDERNVANIFMDIFPSTCELMIHVFGNYVLQKLLDVLPKESDMFKELFEKVKGRLKEYSFHTYGCRVIQSFLVKAPPEIREEILNELKDCIVDCVFDQNANHVAQKIIEVMPEKTQFITDAFLPSLKALSHHPYGCRVLQCVFEKCSPVAEVNIRPLLESVFNHVHEYVMDQYGNYVVQHAMLNAPEDFRKKFVEYLIPHVYALSCSKFASNVAEKTIVKANEEEMQQIVEVLTRPLGGADDGSYLVLMMQDPYANYVVQRLLQEVNKQQQQHIAEQTRRHLGNIRRSVYGQHLVQKMENMGMFSWVEGEICANPMYLEQSAVTSAPNRKTRGGMGVRNGVRVVTTPQSAYLTPVDRSLSTANSYRQPEPTVSVAGRTPLPLGPTGSGCSYGYLDSPSDAMMVSNSQLQQTQPQLMSVSNVTIGTQPCYPGMIPPASAPQSRQYHPHQFFTFQGPTENYNVMESTQLPEQPHQMQQPKNFPGATQFYSNASVRVGQGPGDRWMSPYQTLQTSAPQAMPCSVGTPNSYPNINAAQAF